MPKSENEKNCRPDVWPQNVAFSEWLSFQKIEIVEESKFMKMYEIFVQNWMIFLRAYRLQVLIY